MVQDSNATVHRGGKEESPESAKTTPEHRDRPARGWEWVDEGHPGYDQHRGPGWKMPVSDVAP